MQKLKSDFLISFFFLLLGLLNFVLMVFMSRSLIAQKFNPIQAEKIYNQSQWQQSQNIAPDKARDEWAIRNHYSGWSDFVSVNKNKVDVKQVSDKILASIGKKVVSDSFLYTYVGYKYINGANPSLLNPEHPPLAKYLIGYSINIFGNEHILGIGIAFAVLLLVFIISYLVFGSFRTASLALCISSFFSLFTDQIIHGPQLELYQLFFFLLVLLFLLMGTKRNSVIFYIFAGISYGLLLSTKTFLPFFLIFSLWIVLSFWKKWREIAIVIGVGLITFIITYYQYFALGGTLRTFLGLQKYIVVFYGNAHIPFIEFAGNYLRLIFTGSWKFWDTARSVSFYTEWNIFWPLIFLLGVWRIKKVWRKNVFVNLLINFLILYSLFVFITPIFPRYLLLLYIPLIIFL